MLKLLQIWLLLCLCTWVQLAQAQSAFSVDTTHVSANHPADAPVFYPWIVLTNNTPSALPMICVKVQDQKPSAWETWLEDLDSAYTYVPDTSRFLLLTDTSLANYLIVSFHPNDVPGRASVVLKVYPEADPTDSLLLTFDGNAYRPVTAIDEVGAWGSRISLYPQPAGGSFVVSGFDGEVASLAVYNYQGQAQRVHWERVPTGLLVDMAMPVAGSYIIVLTDGQGRGLVRKLLVH